MSIIRRTLLLSISCALTVLPAFCQFATNLFLLPDSSASAPSLTALRTDPFTVLSTAPIQPTPFTLLLHPNGQKLYSIARSAQNTVVVLEATNPTVVLRNLNLGQAEAAALTPDGRRLLVAAGALHIVDTTTDTVLAQITGAGNAPTDIATSLDGTRAFVLSPSSQTLSAIDLTTNTVLSQNLPVSTTATGVSVGPDGFVYVSSLNLVQVIDGRTMTVLNRIQLNASPGKLIFTANGQYGLAVNRTPITGSTVLRFDLKERRLEGTIPAAGGVVLDRLVYASANRIYAVSKLQASVYLITNNPLTFSTAQLSGVDPAASVLDVAVSGEIPDSRFLFVTTPGRLYRLELTGNPPIVSGQVEAPQQPGPLVHVHPQTTGTPATVLAFNTEQTIDPGGVFQPLIARVTNSQGRPLAGVNVNFTSSNPGAAFQASSVTTNVEGWAQTTVTGPDGGGAFTVTATAGVGTSGPTGTYTLTVRSNSTGGPNADSLAIVRGQGQMIFEQFLVNDPLTVRFVNAQGQPVSGRPVTFALVAGSGVLTNAAFSGEIFGNPVCNGGTCTATTDDNGLASIGFRGDLLQPGFAYAQQSVRATSGEAQVEFFVTTIQTRLPNGGLAGQPSVERIQPTEGLISGRTGTTLPGAVQIRLVAISGPQAGQPIPNVGLRVTTENQDPLLGPVAACDGDGSVALTDPSGIATCNLRIRGRLGVVRLNVDIGASLSLGGGAINLEVLPGPPAVLRILGGNNQSGNPGQRLAQPMVAQVEDASGNILSGQAVTWEVVTPNSITLSNVVSVADANGRVSAFGTLGSIAGPNVVRLRAGTAVQNFTFTTNLTISQMNRISGDAQSTLVGRTFGTALVVEVRDERGNPVPNQAVAWTVVSGTATLSSASAPTDASGRSAVSVTAGNLAGTVVIRAALGSLAQSFTLTVTPPGPVFNAAGIVTTARNQPGVAPCGLATVYGTNIAPGVNGVVSTNFLGIGGLPLSYNGIEVLFGGRQAPIFALANQGGTESIIVQTPCELAPGTTSVLIRIPGAQAQVENVQVLPAAPGIFETPASGTQPSYAAIIRSDGSYVTPSNPARRGEVVYAAVTGLGQTEPGIVTNRIGFGNQSVSAPLVVGVNDSGVRLVSATYANGMVGVYWVGFQIPEDATPGLFRSFAVAAEGPNGLIFGNGSRIAAIQ
jgi:uncharacterized protein (TIGR03437 family)